MKSCLHTFYGTPHPAADGCGVLAHQLPAEMAGPGKNRSASVSGRFFRVLMSFMNLAYFMTFSGFAVYLVDGSFKIATMSATSPLPPIDAISTLAAPSLSALIMS